MSVLVQDCSKSLYIWKSGSLGNVLWLFQCAVTTVTSEQGLSTSRLSKETAPKKQGRPCQIRAGSERHNGAAMLAVFSSEVHLENSWEKICSGPPFLRTNAP